MLSNAEWPAIYVGFSFASFNLWTFLITFFSSSEIQNRCSHILTIKPKVQKTSGIKSLAKGQRINVNGYIRSIKFKISSDKTRSAIAIIPYDIQMMRADDPLPDICFVIMTAHIESRIWDDGRHMSFSLRTHIPFR